ncbi:peptidase M50 [Ensifer sp. 22521]|uniref:peptidase M50 n=1 Tax=Ensifer sp. 22521 TaxID=3453935 RepID=UPI003F84C4F5
MERSYFSSSWYRVAQLKLKLRGHVRIHRTVFRDQLWYVLQDRTSGRFHRFTPETYLIISLMDGHRTMQAIWDIACDKLTDKVVTQDEVIQLLGQLHAADVLFGNVPPDINEIAERGKKARNRKLLMSFGNPLAIRFGLLDPNEFLNATAIVGRVLFSWFGALVFICLVAYAAVLAGMNWNALTANVTDRVLSTSNLFLMLIAYPLIKTLHELGHAYAVKRWGGDVHEVGAMMLVFMPVPYVDASDSLAFASKWQRALVGAAGIFVEMTLAAVALIVWVNAQEGLVRAFAFNVMLIGGVSTLLFNGNPLLRFDGYYVLSDLLEIPNLASRANKYLAYLVQRYAFKIGSVNSPATAPGEEFWFVLYGVSAFFYRLVVTGAIIALVSQKFFIVGTLLAIWALILMFAVPLAKAFWFLLTSPLLRRSRGRAFAVVGSVLAAVALGVFVLPIPHATVVQGIVWLPGDAIVHVQTDGTVDEIAAAPAAEVKAGDPLIRQEDPLLSARVDLLQLRVAELQRRLTKQDLSDLAHASMVKEELRLARADLDLTRQRQENLIVRAPSSGTLILPDDRDLPGKFVRRGKVIAYVAHFDKPTIRVIVPEEDADLVRSQTRDVSLRFVEDFSKIYRAVVVREVPALTDTLPNAALSTAGGGAIALDPRDTSQRRVLANLLHLDLMLTESPTVPRIGGRVFVRFSHGSSPVASRIYRSTRQIFLRLFKV